MSSWKPAGEIEGLFARSESSSSDKQPVETLAQTTNPYLSPEPSSLKDIMANQTSWPGARRRSYLFITLLFPILWGLGLGFATPFLTKTLGEEMTPVVVMAAAFLPLLLGIWFSIQRLANLGMSRWWFLGNFIPLLNFWIASRCFACPAGYRYHKKLDGPGILLAFLFWGLMILSLLAIAAILAVLFAGVGGPELQEQLQEIIKEASKGKNGFDPLPN